MGAPLEQLKDRLRALKVRWLVVSSQYRQSRILRQLREDIGRRRRKIRVVFYAFDLAKWKCQTLYDFMKASPNFDPIVAIGISPLNAVSRQAESAERSLRAKEQFFRMLGCSYVRVANGFPVCFSDLRELKPDVVFLQQPWSLPNEYEPWNISKYALPVYVPYFIQVNWAPADDFGMTFHRCLFRYFAQSRAWADAMTRETRKVKYAGCFVPSGHPALDRLGNEQCTDKDRVIYAPHFSFCHPKNPCLFQMGTFEWNGKEILAYAKEHLEYKWVFKPHPALRDRLISSGLRSGEEADEYYGEWEKIGEVALGGDYQDLFLHARAMITDCGSFLAEFGATGAPIIRLMTARPFVVPNPLSQHYLDSYYRAGNLAELRLLLGKVLERNEDPNREKRIAAVSQAGLLGCHAATSISRYLEDLFLDKDERGLGK